MRKLRNENWKAVTRALALVILAIVLLEATSLIQHYLLRRTIREEATRRAEAHLESTSLRITDVMNQVETVVNNSIWAVRKVLDYPDTLAFLTGRIVETNDFISGSAVAFVENHYPGKGRMFAPYSYRENDEVFATQLGTESYNYLEKEWFVKPLELNAGYWSEPYFDSGGGKLFMTTYSVPLTDNDGKVVAVLTADVSLDWLTGLVSGIDAYPGAVSILISRKGQFMVCPVPSLVMQNTVQEAVANISEDAAAIQHIAQAMLSGERGNQRILYHGEKLYAFYAPVERTGWSMAIIIPMDEIYGNFRFVRALIIALQILGILLLLYILYAAATNQMRLRDITEKKGRIEGELRIARNIQMAMLPKTFPTYPESEDVDMAGEIVPAKEVGGDLYDFFTRENKLYFCIGDVSGKGVPASLVMAVTRSLFRSVSSRETSPRRIVKQMNDSMSETNENNMFVTFFVGVLDLHTGHLRYCNAGHNAPVLMTSGKAALLDTIPNLPLGVMRGFSYKEQETSLATNDGLFLYTDGLTEAENTNHELFGDKRMLEAVTKHCEDKAETQLKSMASSVKGHTRDCNASDDLTMLIVRFTNPAPFSRSERHLVLQNDISQIPKLASFIEDIAKEAKMDPARAMSLNLAMEEAVSNIILYAYPEGAEGQVEVKAVIKEDRLDFTLTDSGVPFDPTLAHMPDLTLDAAERPIGGLGIYLVRSIMDSVAYERLDGKNVLSMTKKL